MVVVPLVADAGLLFLLFFVVGASTGEVKGEGGEEVGGEGGEEVGGEGGEGVERV